MESINLAPGPQEGVVEKGVGDHPIIFPCSSQFYPLTKVLERQREQVDHEDSKRSMATQVLVDQVVNLARSRMTWK